MQRRRYAKGYVQSGSSQNDQCAPPSESAVSQAVALPSGKVWHYELYTTDGYINLQNTFPLINPSTAQPYPDWSTVAASDKTSIANWDGPVYIWGFTDVDPIPNGYGAGWVPNTPHNLSPVPAGALATTGLVGNAKFPAPFIECKMGDHVFITVHNRGFFQNLQNVQDDHSLHLHGIHAQTPYDGFPESIGGYVELLRYFWLEPWYLSHGVSTKQRDDWWNGLSYAQQRTLLSQNAAQAVVKENRLNPSGGIINQRNSFDVISPIDPLADPACSKYPYGVDGLPVDARNMTTDSASQFTYYFTPMHIGTFMYHCHVAASEHVQMGMYGALVVRPADYSATNKTVYGTGTNTNYDKEYTFIFSEFDPLWHWMIEDPMNTSPTHKGALFQGPAYWMPQLWFVNGRTFPQTVLDFGWNQPPAGSADLLVPNYLDHYKDSRYSTLIQATRGQKFLVRYINMGYQEHPIHQHGWHMRIVGSDGMYWSQMKEKFTLLLGSGETYDTITSVDPVYGVTMAAGSPLSTPQTTSYPAASATQPAEPAPNTLKWRTVYPIHDHDDYRVTTNGQYPGGALVLIEVCVPGGKNPTFENGYDSPKFVAPFFTPGCRGNIEQVPPACPP